MQNIIDVINKKTRRSSSDTLDSEIEKPVTKRINFENPGQLIEKSSMETVLGEINSLKLLIKTIQEDQINLKSCIEINTNIIKQELAVKIDEKFEDMKAFMISELGIITVRMNDIENRLAKVEDTARNFTVKPYSAEVSIVAFSVKQNTNEDPKFAAEQLIQQGVGLDGIPVVRAIRLGSRNGKAGVLKIELANKEDKIKVLQNKTNLIQSENHKGVFIRSAQTHAERLIQLNFKTILNELPNGQKYYVTGNGRSANWCRMRRLTILISLTQRFSEPLLLDNQE